VPFTTIAAQVETLPATDLWAGHALAAQLWDPFLAHHAGHQIWLPDRRWWSASPQSRPDT
jgi:hypothetical protein